MKKGLHLLLVFMLLGVTSIAQLDVNWTTSNGMTIDIGCENVNTISYDAPNTAQNSNTSYPAGINVVVTICPQAGSATSVVFFDSAPLFQWNVPDGDVVNIYDGPSTLSPLIGSFSSVTDPGGFQVQSSGVAGGNPTGCITLELISDPNGNGGNLGGQLLCGDVWQPFEPTITSTLPTDPSGDTIRVCFPETIELDATGNFTWMPGDPGYEQTDANSNFVWTMGDGTTYEGIGLTSVSHDYAGTFGYYVVVSIQDTEGQIQRDSMVVQHSTPVQFPGVAPLQDTICIGEETQIEWQGEPGPNGWIPGVYSPPGTYFFGGLFGEQVFIPDWGGAVVPYETVIDVGGFNPGATITSASDIIEICFNMEHSYLGDLEMQIVCPDGTAVTIFDCYVAGQGSNPGQWIPGGFNPGGINLGIPAIGLGAGTGFTYCFSEGMTDFGTFEEEFNAGNWAFPVTEVPPGSYQPAGSFDDLVGCPVNGEWSLQVVDNWGADNGYIFSWGIQIDQSLAPEQDTYQPNIVDLVWTEAPGNPSSPSITNLNYPDSILTIAPGVAGVYEYILTATDDFDCSYDTTITVVAGNIPEISVDDDLTIDCDEDVALLVSIDGIAPPPATCNYVLELIDTFGDTWNGGFVEVIVDGVSIGTFTLDGINDDGSYATFNIPVTHLGSIELIYTGGAFQNENEYNLYAASGDLVFSETNNPPLAGTSFVGETNCQGPGPQYVYTWTPDTFLDNPNIPNPMASGISASTTFVVEVYEEPFSQCAAEDSVTIGLLGELNAGPDIPGCIMCYEMAAFSYLNNGFWTAPPGSGVTFADDTDPTTTVCATIAGTYALTWTDPSGNSCPQADVVMVTFLDEIQPNFVMTEPSCFGDCNGMLEAAPSGGTVAGDYFYEWSTALQGFGENEVSSLCAGSYSLTITDDNGCSFNHNVAVTQPAEVIIDSVSTVREECVGYCNGQIFVYSAAATQYSFDGGATFIGDSIYSEACEGNATIIVQDNNGCFKETTAYVGQPVPPLADFDAEEGTKSVINPLFQFINQSEGNMQNYWYFGPAGLYGTSIESDPFFAFPNEVGTYMVTLVVEDSLGCQDTLMRTVEVIDEFLFFMPNSFTPNGDGVNDFLEVFGSDILASSFEFQLFDRWGRVVYEATDFPFRWDGGGNKNTEYYLESGVYVWRMQTRRASTTDKIEKHGHLTIIR